MKITVEVSANELKEMNCKSPEEFKEQLLHQLAEAVCDDEGGAGADWLCSYTLDVKVVGEK